MDKNDVLKHSTCTKSIKSHCFNTTTIHDNQLAINIIYELLLWLFKKHEQLYRKATLTIQRDIKT